MQALGALMCCLGVKGRTKSWEAHEGNQQFGDKDSMDIGKIQKLRKEGNARLNKVAAMRSGLVKRIEKVCIPWHFESPETYIHIAETACCIDYADTRSSKQFHRLSNCQITHCRTTYSGCEDTLKFNIGFA